METSGGMSAADVIALTGNRSDGVFGTGSIGIFALIIIFILLFGGNGMWGGNAATALGQSDLQNSLYFQSQDNAIRGLAQGQCNLTDTVLNASYNNLLANKDISAQISNSVAALGNQIAEQNQATRNMIMQNKIDMLNDQIVVLRGQNSNLVQTATLNAAIQNSTDTVLNSLGRYRTNPPCYDNCGCGCSLV